ncbi:hypothetical protein [Neorhizobium sp. NCHU2750]|uniref:hypothetical protein n=1 Tax=Neorhizobium sp. NCHU2750 TaxID=1825976 RepID=UPI000E75EF89|nr:hypothetical protein NCHU2750_15260 [Neorhizobium sp. NCHU2750]
MVQSVYDHTNSRQVAQIVNQIVQAIDSATGSVNLTNSTTTTTVSNAKVTTSSRIFLQPRNSAAVTSGAFVSSISSGSFVITHASATTVRTFDYLIFAA